MRRAWSAPACAAVAFVVGVTACGDDSGPGTDAGADAGVAGGASSTIGPEGGKVATDGVTVTVPPGALEKATKLSVSRVDDEVPARYTAHSPMFRFEPDGLLFLRPVTVGIDVEGNAPGAALFWSVPGGDGFARAGGRMKDGVVTAQVRHFSDGFAGEANPCELAFTQVDQDPLPDQAGWDPRLAVTGDFFGKGYPSALALTYKVGSGLGGVVFRDLGTGETKSVPLEGLGGDDPDLAAVSVANANAAGDVVLLGIWAQGAAEGKLVAVAPGSDASDPVTIPGKGPVVAAGVAGADLDADGQDDVFFLTPNGISGASAGGAAVTDVAKWDPERVPLAMKLGNFDDDDVRDLAVAAIGAGFGRVNGPGLALVHRDAPDAAWKETPRSLPSLSDMTLDNFQSLTMAGGIEDIGSVDFDDDDLEDLVIRVDDGTVGEVIAFRPADDEATVPDDIWRVMVPASGDEAVDPNLVVFDPDQSGRPSVATGSDTGIAVIDAEGTLQQEVRIDPGMTRPILLEVDIDADGLPDLVAIDGVAAPAQSDASGGKGSFPLETARAIAFLTECEFNLGAPGHACEKDADCGETSGLCCVNRACGTCPPAQCVTDRDCNSDVSHCCDRKCQADPCPSPEPGACKTGADCDSNYECCAGVCERSPCGSLHTCNLSVDVQSKSGETYVNGSCATTIPGNATTTSDKMGDCTVNMWEAGTEPEMATLEDRGTFTAESGGKSVSATFDANTKTYSGSESSVLAAPGDTVELYGVLDGTEWVRMSAVLPKNVSLGTDYTGASVPAGQGLTIDHSATSGKFTVNVFSLAVPTSGPSITVTCEQDASQTSLEISRAVLDALGASSVSVQAFAYDRVDVDDDDYEVRYSLYSQVLNPDGSVFYSATVAVE